MQPLVSVGNLSKSFHGVKALDRVRFDLMPGEVHALMGENGAGKSTPMKILAGVCSKDSGEILLDGQPVDITSPALARALAIGIIHQELHLMPHLNAAQNIFLGREPKKVFGLLLDEAQINRDTRALFQRMNLALDPQTRVSDLTVARQQMVEIARALSYQSRVLIMDEPTAALNNVEIEDLFRIIRQLRAEGVGIVYVSHKMAEKIGGAGEVAVIGHAQTSTTGTGRGDGFVNRIKSKYPNIKVVDIQYSGGDHLKSAEIAKTLVQAHPNILAVVGWMDLTDHAAPEHIARWRGHAQLKGLRHILQDESDVADWVGHPQINAALAAVQRAELVYDVLVCASTR